MMLDLLFIPSAILYLLVVGALFVYGVNFFYLTYITLRDRRAKLPQPPLSELPPVTIQLPIYNEMYVAERLIAAAAALDYPRALLEIQVLDDSTDETREIVARKVAQLQLQGFQIFHLHRKQRSGYKAGALAEGLKQAQGEFIAIFDADFIPGRDFLRRTLPYFSDPGVAFVQTRWGHVNRDYSLLTQLQSLAIDAHFMVEQFARSQAGLWFNFNGTAGIWRKAAMLDAGGWRSDTLTEDLDLSYRAFFKGWKAVYLRDVEVPAELPVSFNAYRRQQGRWARGSLECALRFIPQVWGRAMPLRQKVQATLHLSGYCVHLLLAALVFLYPLVLEISRHYPALVTLFGIGFFFNLTAFAPTIFFVVAESQLGRRVWRDLPVILFVSAMGTGMMVNTLRATAGIAFNRKGTFERTPKFGIVQRKQTWMNQHYQLKLDLIVFPELALALANTATAVLAIHQHNWMIAVYACLFSCGLFFTSGMTILQSLSVARQHAPLIHQTKEGLS
jgi:cellulose synthase/poly-beta-1,6-N-acetylglucosamine synthase-like glycosyltransferase